MPNIKELIAAVRKNGYPQIQGAYFELKNGDRIENGDVLPNKDQVVGACAFGQAALNLGISPSNLKLSGLYDVHTKVVQLNDDDELTLEEIADKLEGWFADYVD